jgi:hypothetical protein
LVDAKDKNAGVYDPDKLDLESYARYRCLALARIYERRKALEAYQYPSASEKRDERTIRKALREASRVAREEARKAVLEDRFFTGPFANKIRAIAEASAEREAAIKATQILNEALLKNTLKPPHKKPQRSSARKDFGPAISPKKTKNSPFKRMSRTSRMAMAVLKTPPRMRPLVDE